VSLNDKTGGLSTTADITGAEAVLVEFEPAASGPVPPQALKKMTMASSPAGLKNEWRRFIMNKSLFAEKFRIEAK
jgi:hypothetical protein